MRVSYLNRGFRAGSSLNTLAVVGAGAAMSAFFAPPALAQDAAATPTTPAATTAPAADDQTDGNDIVITGTLFRGANGANIASPVTTVTADDLNKRGISTVQSALQMLASNNGPALTNSFAANGAFAGGASSVSLRGLSTNSTLVLFDGLRAAYYPLADDGSRNFVDLNTIPDAIVDRIEVLRDGASSSYGADAIAGVVNVITKRQVTGVQATVEAGITERGDAANQRLSLTAGIGDLSTQRFNVYVNVHYLHQDMLHNRDLGYPYNTANQTGICFDGNCGADLRANSPLNYGGVSASVPIFLVRPANPTTFAAIPGSRYQFLNPTNGCGRFQPYNPTAAELAGFPNSPTTVCVQDQVADGNIIEPKLTRLGASARATMEIGDRTHAYVEFNFEQSTVSYTGYGLAGPFPTNSLVRAQAPAGILYPAFSTAAVASAATAPGSAPLALPVYICPRLTVGACTAANGTLNPQNPFAAAGQVALVLGTTPDLSQFTATRSRAYRLAGGINGTFGDEWDWRVDGVGMVNDLRRQFSGYVYIQHLLDVVRDGSYNFVNPSANTQAVRDYLAPTLLSNANSEMYQLNATLTHALFNLPGGPLQFGIGGAVRYESVYAPSANPDYNGPTQRYFNVNAFGTIGHRWVQSGFFEIKAPVFDQLSLEGSGRYDHYSSGQSNFSPKAGVVIKPVRGVLLRGSISGGFRIPSFGETSALPTTGYVPYFTQLPAAYLAQFSNPGVTCTASSPANCSVYVSAYTVGEKAVANPALKPEKSRNITLGAEFKPTRWLTLSGDYYNIRKTGAIQPAPFGDALKQYYANGTMKAGYTFELAAPDVNHPLAPPVVATVGAPFINANKIETEGVEFGAQYSIPLFGEVRLSGNAEAAYVIKLNTVYADGHVERYVDTLGNFNLTSGSGTFRWKGSWQNTLEFGKIGSLTATAYYTNGYNLSADDQNSGRCTDPDPNSGNSGLDGGLQPCRVKPFFNLDLTGEVNVGERFTFYVNVLNVLNTRPPLDTVTYSGYLYNSVQAEQGIIGRAFRAGVRAKF
ncbi:TonB-dependent receptor [Sphingomonas panacisoli]|uniref:TonB-dependent receptor n=1 Tax=Sphingomonas panacisoli TaxID=1813879 RepID=A0A5B8LE89_9SPHN|nr:TonB-dependent receptor [Sphingomonas panacisoli]QDZ06383.1 TonB-dependent receptor [Sphingomonas panacisoli]